MTHDGRDSTDLTQKQNEEKSYQIDLIKELNGLNVERRSFLRGTLMSSLAAGGFSSFPQLTAAQEEKTITVEQGDSSVEVTPLSTGETIEEFYDYYNARSHTSTNIEQSDASLLFFWEGPNGLSLVVLHDKGNDGSGGACTFEFSGLPTDQGRWIVPDDSNDFDSDTDTSPDWKWADTKTDGGVFRGGLDEDFEISINPRFNEDAVETPLTPGEITDWQLLSGNASSPDRITLNMSEPLTIHTGAPLIESFNEVKTEKLELANQITGLSPTINERKRVESTLSELEEQFKADQVDIEVAIEAVERMKLGENVTEALLAGLTSETLSAPENDTTLIGAPEDSPATDESINVSGGTIELAFEFLVSLLLAMLALAKMAGGLGRFGGKIDAARSHLKRTARWVVDVILGAIDTLVSNVKSKSNAIASGLAILVFESGIVGGEELLDTILDEISGVKDDFADDLLGHYEPRLDTALNNFDTSLGGGETGKPEFYGEDPELAAEKGISEVNGTIEAGMDDIDTIKNTTFIVDLLGAAAAALTASGVLSYVGVAAQIFLAAIGIAGAFIGIFFGAGTIQDAIALHNNTLDEIVKGQVGD